jgi:hypothetical protein
MGAKKVNCTFLPDTEPERRNPQSSKKELQMANQYCMRQPLHAVATFIESDTTSFNPFVTCKAEDYLHDLSFLYLNFF